MFRRMFILLPDRHRMVHIISNSSDKLFSICHSYILLQPSPLITVHIYYYMCSIPAAAALAIHDNFVISHHTFLQYLRSWRPPPLLHALLPPKVCFVKSTAVCKYSHQKESFHCYKMIIDHLQQQRSLFNVKDKQIVIDHFQH